MKILVTGANGFIGKNLICELKNQKKAYEILDYDIDTNPALLSRYCQEAAFVFHLAGVNRPKEEKEFIIGNYDLTFRLLKCLEDSNNPCPVMMSSSTQALVDNPYGASKRAGEELLFAHGKKTGARVLLYRFPNVFGKWCRPNYNSVVATFCHHIARDMEITVHDPEVVLQLIYIDDVVEEMLRALAGNEKRESDFCQVEPTYTISLRTIVELLYSFKNSRENCTIPNMQDEFTKKLYSTYLSYLPEEQFNYELKMNVDQRGSFTEFLKSSDRGQVSINIAKPGITKGNHWHHTKNEKFLVVSGSGVIRFRSIEPLKRTGDRVIEYLVSGEKLEVIDIPVGYTHNIENLGETDMVTIMWANETFDPERPDTYFQEV